MAAVLSLGLFAGLAASAAAAATNKGTIFSIATKQGSLGGRTRVTVNGAGFGRGDEDGSTQVWVGPNACEIEPYDSDDSQLVCYTPPSAVEGTVSIQVSTLALNTRHLFAACPTNDCYFQYRWDRTPRVDYAPLGGRTGGIYRAFGTFYSSTTDPYEIRVGGGAGQGSPGGGRGGSSCTLDDDLYTNPSSILLGPPNGFVKCRLGGQIEAGRYNMTMRVEDKTYGYGQAIFNRRAQQVGPDGTPFHFTQVPHVNGVSVGASGLVGGQEVTISGSSFAWNPASNQVWLAGVPCNVTSSTNEEIKCKVGPAAASSPAAAVSGVSFPGGRGLVHRLWVGIPTQMTGEITAPPTQTFVNQHGLFGYFDQDYDYYTQEATGFFVPPVTANYTFYTRADDLCNVWLSTTDSPANASLIASTAGYQSYWWSTASQTSKPQLLQGGKRYWFRVRHADGNGGDFFEVGLRIGTEGNADAAALLASENQRSMESLAEVQTISTRSTVVREVQEITLTGVASGMFTLDGAYLSDGTPRILYTTSVSDVASAAASVTGCGGVSAVRAATNSTVDGAPGWKWTVTLSCPTAAGFAPLTVRSLTLQPLAGFSVRTSTRRVQAASTPISGYFFLKYNGTTLPDALPFDAGNWRIAAALNAVPGVSVSVDGYWGTPADGATWAVTFNAPYGDIPALEIVTSTQADGQILLGNAVAVTVTEQIKGSADVFLWPAPMEYFQTGSPLPAVTVMTNGILGDCDVFNYNATAGIAPCVFRYDDALTPTVSGVSPSTVTAGDTLTVTGTGFLTAAAGVGKGPGGSDLSVSALNSVYLNGSRCNVTAATATQLQCTVDHTPAGVYDIAVEVGQGRGYARVPAGAAVVTYPLSIAAVTPASGSEAGGTLLSITGTGFRGVGDVVTVGGSPCTVVPAATRSYSSMVCRTPAKGASVSAAISVNGVAPGTTFTYDAAKTASVASLTPAVLSTAITGIVNITVASLPAGASVAVSFGTRTCAVQSTWASGANTVVSCRLVRGPALPLPQSPVAPTVDVSVAGVSYGYAAVVGGVALNTAFRVDAMSTTAGSLEGGTVVTFTGTGYSPLGWPDEVVFQHFDSWGYEWRTNCPVTGWAADGSSMTCVMPAIPLYKKGSPKTTNATTPISGLFWVKVNNVTAPCAAGLNACAFTLSMASTPVISAVNTVVDATTPSGFALEFVTAATSPALPANSNITLGRYFCAPVTVLSASTVRCGLPVGTADTFAFSVLSPAMGYARLAASAAPNYTFPFAVSSVSASSGSTYGGSTIVIRGAGFADDVASRNLVRVGATRYAVVQSANATTIVALTPAGAAGLVDILVTVLDTDAVNPIASGTLPAAWTYAAGPTVTSVTPASGVAGAVLTIRGSGFGNATDPATTNAADGTATSVSIGGRACAVNSVNNTVIVCTLGESPAGAHRVLVFVGRRGLAATSTGTFLTFTALLRIDSVSPKISSFGGGARLTVRGAGFGGASDTNSILLSNHHPCVIKSATYDTVVCETTAMVTPLALSTWDAWVPSVLMGTPTTSSAIPAFDGNVETITYSACTLTTDLGAYMGGVVTGIKFWPRFKYSYLMKNGVFSGSRDGVTWTTLGTAATPMEGSNELRLLNYPEQTKVDLGSQPVYRFLRFAFAPSMTGTACTLADIQFLGIPVSTSAGACNVSATVTAAAPFGSLSGTVAAASTIAPQSEMVQFSVATTPYVASLYPNNGTALGGTLITLTGTGFPPSNTAEVTVTLNGIACAVQTTSATAVTCITGARSTINPLSVDVRVSSAASGGAYGAAVYDGMQTYFRYLDRWSSLTTWKYQEPPVDGDTIVVPAGQSILVDVPSPLLFLVLIQGDLIFDNKDLTFDANYILIDGGTFQVGLESAPFLNKLTITVHGDRYTSIEVPEWGSKAFAASDSGTFSAGDPDHEGGMTMVDTSGAAHHSAMTSGHDMSPSSPQGRVCGAGIIDLHGAPRKRVWTLLAATAAAGSDTISTTEDVDWQPGEVIAVLAPGNFYQSEEKVVKEVLGPRSLRVTTPFLYDHVSEVIPAGAYGHSDIDERAEVGLLSRNVKVQGDENSPRQLFGVHVGVFHAGTLRSENIEITRAGQAGQLGRYPQHTHMVGNGAASYVRYNSIHHTHQRCTTIHATNYASVKGNFDFKALGHTLFVEDGVERFNEIENNLVGYTLPCYICTDSDVKPANFWTASPTNHWRHNRAAGSTHFGYWFELPTNPMGPSFTTDYCPVNMPLGSFFNNSAHSSSIGLRVYPQFQPRVTPCDTNSPAAPQYFYNSTMFKNSLGTFHRNVGHLSHVNAKIADNGAGWQWKKYVGGVTVSWIPNIQDSLFLCDSKTPGSCGVGFTGPQTEFWSGAGMTMVNYAKTPALAGCHDCESSEDFSQGGYTYRYWRSTFINSQVRYTWNPPRKDIVWDLDGTLTGIANGTALPYYGFNSWPECTRDTVGTYSFGHICDATVQVRRMQLDQHLPRELDFVSLNVTSDAGWGLVQFRPREFYGWSWPAVNRKWYMHKWAGSLIDFRQLRLRYSEPEYIANSPVPNEWIGASFGFIDYRYRYRVDYGAGTDNVPALPGPARPMPTEAFGAGNLPDGNKTWHVMLSTVNATSTDRSKTYAFTAYAIQCPPGGCGGPGSGDLGNATLWSDVKSWTSGRLPLAGEDVTINATQYIIMDVNPPKLGRLTIIGKLEFQDSADRKLQADAIVVWGELSVGTVAKPFLNNAEISLFGVRESPSVVLDNNLFLSNKVMAVLGKVSMAGRPRAIVHTKLASTAAVGATSITLTTSVAGVWYAGDRIVLSATDFAFASYETATIAAVNGATVTLTAPLQYRHFAGPLAASGVGATTFLRASVGLLSRNVVFRGNLADASDTYGASIVVSSKKDRDAASGRTTVWSGSLDARYVQFASMGKMRTEQSGILFQYGNFLFDPAIPATNPFNVLEGVTFSDSLNTGVLLTAAKHLVVNASIFHNNYRNSFDADAASINATLTNNLFVGNLVSPDVYAADQIPWVRPQSAVFLDAVPGRMSGNIVSGATDAAFTYRVPQCTANAALYSGNEAHGVRIGAFLLPTDSPVARCLQVPAFTVWKAAHVGILAVDQVSPVVIDNAVLADNHIGISLNYFGGHWKLESFSRVTNSIIAGATSTAASCADSSVCRAMAENDVRGDGCNSVVGAGYRRVGFMVPQYTARAKICDRDSELPVCRPPNQISRPCSMPWENRYGVIGAINTAFYLTNVRFIGFNSTDCGKRSVAIAHNPTQIDLAVPGWLSGLAWEGVDAAAKFSFRTSAMTDVNCADGVGCDALNNYNLYDIDGTATGTAKTSVTGPNPLNVYGTPTCRARNDWNGFECPGFPLRTGYLEAVDGGRVLYGQLQVEHRRNLADNSTWRTSLSAGSFKEPCSMQGPQPIHATVVTPGTTEHLMWPSTEPGTIRYRYLSKDAADKNIINLFVARPYAWDMYVDGVNVPMLEAPDSKTFLMPQLTDAPGTWVFNPQLRHIWFTVQGGAPNRIYDLVRAPTVQLNLHLAISVEQFFGDELINNLAILLKIDPWRIKIVDVRAGSANVQVEIRDNSTTVLVSNPTSTTAADNATLAAATAQFSRMQELANRITSIVQSGQMTSIGSIPVLEVAMLPPVASVASVAAATSSSTTTADTGPIVLTPNSNSGAAGKLSGGAIAGIAVGAIFAVTLVAVGLVVRKRMLSTDRSSLFRRNDRTVVPTEEANAVGIVNVVSLDSRRTITGAPMQVGTRNPVVPSPRSGAPVGTARKTVPSFNKSGFQPLSAAAGSSV